MKRPNRRPGNAARWTTIAVAAAVLLAVPVFAQIQFSDVPDNDPHRRDIDAVAGERWFVGYRDGTYKPDQEISPSEMTRVLTRAFEGLTRAEFASFMVAGNAYIKRVTNPLPLRWDPYGSDQNSSPGRGNVPRYDNHVAYLHVVSNHPSLWLWSEDGHRFIEPGTYRIDGVNRWGRRVECRWMRLGYIPEGGQGFDTIAATDAPLAGYFQNEYTEIPYIIRILPTDTAFMTQCFHR